MSQPVNLELLQIFFEDARDALREWERVCLKLTTEDEISALEPLLRCAHNLKGGAALIGLTAMHQKMHRFEDFLTELRDLKARFTPSLVSTLLSLEHFIHNWVDNLRTDPGFTPDTAAMDASLALALSEASSTPEGPTFAAPTIEAKSSRGDETTRGEETVRVSATKLDQLIQLVGELSLHHSIIERASREGALHESRIRTVIDIKSKLTQDLQDIALSLRMVPVDSLFQRAERVARQTATDLKKTVAIIRRGDDVNLDKVVVERMHEPLLHLARNAVDHGIESADERKAAGKAPQGTIRISAETSTSGVYVVFEDDGRGIDPDKVYAKALALSLVSASQELSPEARLRLIFLPGLSTAAQVTEVSGRGVGLDVVNDTVRQMGGRVEIQSTIGKGTKFSISLPTNLAIVDALVVKVAGCQYAIPNQELKEVLNLSEHSLQTVQAGRSQVINLRGRVLPIEHMATFLPHAAQSKKGAFPEARPSGPGIVVHHRDLALALAVDEVMGQQQIFVRPVINSLVGVSFFSGSTILSDGEPSMILNLGEMARRYFDEKN